MVSKLTRKPLKKPGARRGPRSAAQRVTGLLVMLPWIMQRGRVKISTMAKQFNLSEAELVDDLQMAAVCGVPLVIIVMVLVSRATEPPPERIRRFLAEEVHGRLE